MAENKPLNPTARRQVDGVEKSPVDFTLARIKKEAGKLGISLDKDSEPQPGAMDRGRGMEIQPIWITDEDISKDQERSKPTEKDPDAK